MQAELPQYDLEFDIFQVRTLKPHRPSPRCAHASFPHIHTNKAVNRPTCRRPCLSPNPNESDDARLMVESVTMANKCGDDSALRNWLTDATKADDLILVECTYFIRTLDRERYYNHCVWVVWYQRLVKAYCTLEDEENARKWASKAAKLHKAYALTDGGWDAVAKDPRSTDWWGLRVKNGVRIVPNLDEVNVEKVIAPTDELRPGDQVVTTIQGSRL